MAENITTLLEKPDAENVQGSDYLYIVQGSGSKRDRKIKLEALFASDPAHTLVVDEHDLIPKRYLLPSFAKSNEVTRLTPEGGQVYFISKEVTRDGGTARAISGVIANKSITSDLIGDNSVSTDKIIDGSVTPEKIDNSGTYTVGGLRFNNELSGTEVGVAAVRNEKKLLIDGAVRCDTLDAAYGITVAETSTYDLTGTWSSATDAAYNVGRKIMLFNSTDGQCRVTVRKQYDGSTGETRDVTVLLNSGNVGEFIKVSGDDGTTTGSPRSVFAPVSFSRTLTVES